jgi:hypothetical protein
LLDEKELLEYIQKPLHDILAKVQCIARWFASREG